MGHDCQFANSPSYAVRGRFYTWIVSLTDSACLGDAPAFGIVAFFPFPNFFFFQHLSAPLFRWLCTLLFFFRRLMTLPAPLSTVL